MESSAALRSLNLYFGVLSHVQSLPEKTGLLTMHHYSTAASSKLKVQGLSFSGNILSPSGKRSSATSYCVKTTKSAVDTKPNVGSIPVSIKRKSVQPATFPNGYEALLLEVCDETQIAELKLKVGNFEMNVKRKVGATQVPAPVISPVASPSVPADPVNKPSSGVSPPPLPPPSKPASAKISPFTNVTFGKSSKLEALEALGSVGHVLVSSPKVGSFRKSRTVKGKKQSPGYKEGDFIKEGQVIGWLDQFGTELPLKSDVSGEVLKLLVDDGEAVGFGDPLIAVLPSFPGVGVQ